MQTSPSSTLVKCPSRDTGKWKESGIERGSIQGEWDGKFKAYGKNNVENVIEGSDNAIVQMVMLLFLWVLVNEHMLWFVHLAILWQLSLIKKCKIDYWPFDKSIIWHYSLNVNIDFDVIYCIEKLFCHFKQDFYSYVEFYCMWYIDLYKNWILKIQMKLSFLLFFFLFLFRKCLWQRYKTCESYVPRKKSVSAIIQQSPKDSRNCSGSDTVSPSLVFTLTESLWQY